MTKAPYPGYPPCYREVDQIGGYARTCLVIELLADKQLTPVELALIQEQLEATLTKLQRQLGGIESSQVVTSDRFDHLLQIGLRLS